MNPLTKEANYEADLIRTASEKILDNPVRRIERTNKTLLIAFPRISDNRVNRCRHSSIFSTCLFVLTVNWSPLTISTTSARIERLEPMAGPLMKSLMAADSAHLLQFHAFSHSFDFALLFKFASARHLFPIESHVLCREMHCSWKRS